MLNKCIFMGRLTKDPEVRYTQGTEPVAVARFSLAVNQDYKKDGEKATDFFEVEAWRQRAEFCGKYLRKGQLICAEGSMHQNNWEDKNGNKHYGYRLLVNNVYFAESKKQDNDQANQMDSGGDRDQIDASPSPGFDPMAGDTGSGGGFDPFAGDGDMSMNISGDDEDLPF